MTDLTDPEHASRWQVREPDSDQLVSGVQAFDADAGWLQLVVQPGATSEEFELDEGVRKRKKGPPPIVAPPVVVRRWQDYDVFDLLNEVVTARVRR
jgi:hypothetical protein